MVDKRFERFFIDNYPKVVSFATRLLMSEAAAEDVTQDVFMKLYERPDIWRDKCSESSRKYLFTMTRNHVYNIIKRRGVERKYQEFILHKYDVFSEATLKEKLQAKELEEIVLDAIEKMPKQRKRVFEMSRLEGLTNLEIADNLKLSVRTVERHIYLALSDLKKILLILIFFIE